MAAYEEDLDDDLLVEIPCEFCNDPFPLYLLIEHQTGCRPDLTRIIEPTVEEIEVEFLHAASFEEKTKQTTKTSEDVEELKDITPKDITPKENQIPKEKDAVTKKVKRIKDETEYQVIEDHLLQGSETTFTFGSTPSKEKKVEDEKPSFRIPAKPILNESENINSILNELSDSENEEGESLEEFWKKADIKLAQMLRAAQKQS